MAAVLSNHSSPPLLNFQSLVMNGADLYSARPGNGCVVGDAPVKTFVIVGAGNFGAATALSLKTKHPDAKVILVDSTPFPNPRAASHDINKIVRDDYPDPLYMRMMLQGMRLWKDDALYSPYFHRTGYLRADTSNFSDQALATYEELGVRNEAGWLAVDEVRRRFPPLATTNFDGIDRVFWHPDAGWADAEAALKAVTETAVTRGVMFRQAGVDRVLIDPEGKCAGVKLSDGQEVRADVVLLCTGAQTAALLANSIPDQKELQAVKRVSAAGAVSFYAKISGEKKERFKNVPVLKNCLKHTKGEAMSMTNTGILKFNVDLSFTYLQNHQRSNQKLSIPPSSPEFYTWSTKFPQTLVERCKQTMKGLYGDEAKDIEIESFRMCWDAVTPLHDFLITQHPIIPNLAIATGGSFHGWKFLPVIGDYIVQMLDAELPEEYKARWGWDSHLHINTAAQAKMAGNGYNLSNGTHSNATSTDIENKIGMTRPTVMANPTYKTQIDLSELLVGEKAEWL